MSQHLVDLKNKKRYFVISRPDQRGVEMQNKSGQEIPTHYISWEASEYLYFEKTRNWTLTLFAGGVALAVIFAAMGNYSGVAVILIGTFVVYLLGHRAPRYINHKITPLGIEIDGRVFLFDELQSFWIIYHESVKELILRSKKTFIPLIHLQLEYADPNEIRKILLDFLPEKEEEEPLSHIIAHLLRF